VAPGEDSVNAVIGNGELVLVTGSTGFLGTYVVEQLLERGLRNVRCFARASSDVCGLKQLAARYGDGHIEVVRGNLLSAADCDTAARDVAVVYHLAAGMGEKSFPDAFMNSVVTTRNLLDASVRSGTLKRFVNISSFAVYTNRDKPQHNILDESCPVEADPALRGEAYCYAKVKQDELVMEYGRKHAVPYVIVRPGAVYGPGSSEISSRVGSGAFGVFLHLGGSNVIPFTYVGNCADAIALAGLRPGIEGEVLNIVDDDLPTSRRFLRLYKKHVRSFASVPVPRPVSYVLCALWERYSAWSQGQLPPVFNRRAWHAYWKGSRYSNTKAKRCLGWTPTVTTDEGLRRYFESCCQRGRDVA
jgi:nucleoside-diphosphate-sugar epimerase